MEKSDIYGTTLLRIAGSIALDNYYIRYQTADAHVGKPGRVAGLVAIHVTCSHHD